MQSKIVVCAIITKKDKYLLGQRPKNIGPYPNTWHLLGGGVNLGEETLIEALEREVYEESGLKIKNIIPLGFIEDREANKHGEITQYIFLRFMAKYKSGEIKANDDIYELKWFTKDELKKLLLPRPSISLFKELNLI